MARAWVVIARPQVAQVKKAPFGCKDGCSQQGQLILRYLDALISPSKVQVVHLVGCTTLQARDDHGERNAKQHAIEERRQE
jgi:hypothetical protein